MTAFQFEWLMDVLQALPLLALLSATVGWLLFSYWSLVLNGDKLVGRITRQGGVSLLSLALLLFLAWALLPSAKTMQESRGLFVRAETPQSSPAVSGREAKQK